MAIDRLNKDWSLLKHSAAEIQDAMQGHNRRVLLFGSPGVGKSTLAKQLGQFLTTTARPCWCICADPGSPAFGIPGVVTLGKWEADAWQVIGIEAVCSLDAGRFRLPLVTAVRRLAQQSLEGMVLIDGPGVVRSVAGKEMLQGLVEAAEIDTVLFLTRDGRPKTLFDELRASAVEVFVVGAATEAARPGKRTRARQRTGRWDNYLADATKQRLDLTDLNIIGTPPPMGEPSAWVGRQIALLKCNQTVTMGEVLRLENNILKIIVRTDTKDFDTVLIRDAARTANGVVETAVPFASESLEYITPSTVANGGPRVVGQVGMINISLINGVFGDPMLHVRFRHQRRSLLFDLGQGGRLPARMAHQVTDVFISHAHIDHIGGFLGLLRSRIGEFPPCRLFGPPGLAQHVQGFVQGILWDRVAERGPSFEVSELHGDYLRRFRIQCGCPDPKSIGDVQVTDGVLLEEPEFRVRSALLDHRTPVIAYAFEPSKQINIRKDRLLQRGLTPGPWLTELRSCLMNNNYRKAIKLPDGSEESAGALEAELVLISPGKKLVYATDLADTPDNRQRLVGLAKHAHTFFCEATFSVSDTKQATRTGHLTTHACGEIATAAEVARLVPFHFSRRYAPDPLQLYEEIQATSAQVVVPKSMDLFKFTKAGVTEPVASIDIE